MSTVVVSTSAALGRLFGFDEPDSAEPCLPERSGKSPKRTSHGVEGYLPSINSGWAGVVPASRLGIRPAPEMAPSGIAALDALTGGLPRGCLTEICGPASSGRTTVLLAALAAATHRGEVCALLDTGDSFDPTSAAAAGVDFNRLLWVRCGDETPQTDSPRRHRDTKKTFMPSATSGCPISRAPFAREVGIFSQTTLNFEGRKSHAEHRLEQLLRAADLLLESGGFGLIVLDVADVPPQAARRIPLTTWFRFRRAVEHKPTILLAIEERPIAGSCSSVLLQLGVPDESAAEGQKKMLPAHTETDLPNPPHAQLLTGRNITAELIRSRLNRKPACSVAFATKTAWVG